jgi:hypothetical protein
MKMETLSPEVKFVSEVLVYFWDITKMMKELMKQLTKMDGCIVEI